MSSCSMLGGLGLLSPGLLWNLMVPEAASCAIARWSRARWWRRTERSRRVREGMSRACEAVVAKRSWVKMRVVFEWAVWATWVRTAFAAA